MAENRKLLLLRLEGTLQSWGEDAKWDFRGSGSMSTKSGIVGLLSCALGLERGDPEIAALSKRIRVTVRADRPGLRTEDYQTVTGAPLRNAEGKPRSTGNTFISKRVYLQDASFLAVVEGEDALLVKLAAALQSPRWCLFLGRKSCVPSRPVFEALTEDYTDAMDVLRHYPLAERAKWPVSYETEQPSNRLASMQRPDERLDGGRSFALRRVWRGVIREEDYGSC